MRCNFAGISFMIFLETQNFYEIYRASLPPSKLSVHSNPDGRNYVLMVPKPSCTKILNFIIARVLDSLRRANCIRKVKG